MLSKVDVINLASQYAQVVRPVINPKKVILYGSYAKDKATSNSDIDIAVIVDNLKNIDYLDMSKQLYKLRRDISIDIEPILLDMSDDKSGFLSEVIRTGIEIK